MIFLWKSKIGMMVHWFSLIMTIADCWPPDALFRFHQKFSIIKSFELKCCSGGDWRQVTLWPVLVHSRSMRIIHNWADDKLTRMAGSASGIMENWEYKISSDWLGPQLKDCQICQFEDILKRGNVILWLLLW